ncbi:ultraviolet-B receptor UVR8-like [Camellia sinensis]|uniref:ultraviolet-B receptor UVR8-like n=1 Tax=Camellia sinensis TaxID=4442 RepID=UPI0010360DBB|nr:ultraviolet-B receptor UVR8-like [Camellia sinensis]
MVLVACGWRHTISVSSSGGLYTYGWSKYGQLGHGDFEDHLIPHRLEALRENFISQRSQYSVLFLCLLGDKKVVQISCGWRHTLVFIERQNVFSWGKGTNGQLGHGESVDRNIPKMIESLSADGSSGQQIESSKLDPSTGKALVSPIERYAVVPDDNVSVPSTVFIVFITGMMEAALIKRKKRGGGRGKIKCSYE